MKCRAAVYEGAEPYIFVSYCHEDQARVYPYIETLAGDGYRVWYDEGITPGEEWMENIARHLEASSVFIAFITEASLNSHNCRREINFAIQRNKRFVALYLDDVTLSRGMEMALSSVQGIYRSHYHDAEEYIQKLYSAPGLEECRGERHPEIIGGEGFIDEEETVTLTQGAMGFAMGVLETYLLRIRTQEKIPIHKNAFTIGRSRNHSDYAMPGEGAISRRHATIHRIDDSYMIVDNRSLNHVGLNGRLIPPDTKQELAGFDVISLAREHMVFFRDYDEAAVLRQPGFLLRDEQSSWEIGGPVTRIGSAYPESDGRGCEVRVDGPGVLPLHAFLILTSGGLYAVDVSGTHSTAVNGQILQYCDKAPLSAGDTLTVAGHSFDVIRDI